MIILEPEKRFFFKPASANDAWQHFGKVIQSVLNCHSIVEKVK